MPGMRWSETMTRKRLRRMSLERLEAARRGMDLVGALEEPAQRVQHARLVVDEKHRRQPCAA